jgi:hypothetical protein
MIIEHTNPETLRRIDDYVDFARCPLKVQKSVIMRINWIIEIEQAARGQRGQVIARAADALGVSIPTVNRFVRAFCKHGWQGLIDQRGGNARPLPPEFKAFVRTLHLQCQRATTGREVLRFVSCHD